MAEFHPVRETLLIATAAILAAVLAVFVIPGNRNVGGLVVLVFLLLFFLAMTLYLAFRLFYMLRKEGS